MRWPWSQPACYCAANIAIGEKSFVTVQLNVNKIDAETIDAFIDLMRLKADNR